MWQTIPARHRSLLIFCFFYYSFTSLVLLTAMTSNTAAMPERILTSQVSPLSMFSKEHGTAFTKLSKSPWPLLKHGGSNIHMEFSFLWNSTKVKRVRQGENYSRREKPVITETGRTWQPFWVSLWDRGTGSESWRYQLQPTQPQAYPESRAMAVHVSQACCKGSEIIQASFAA